MFSPRKRSSLASFLLRISFVRASGAGDDVVVESMLKQEDAGERDVELMVTAELEGFIFAVRGTGSDRS